MTLQQPLDHLAATGISSTGVGCFQELYSMHGPVHAYDMKLTSANAEINKFQYICRGHRMVLAMDDLT